MLESYIRKYPYVITNVLHMDIFVCNCNFFLYRKVLKTNFPDLHILKAFRDIYSSTFKGKHDHRLMKRQSPCVRSWWSSKLCKGKHDLHGR